MSTFVHFICEWLKLLFLAIISILGNAVVKAPANLVLAWGQPSMLGANPPVPEGVLILAVTPSIMFALNEPFEGNNTVVDPLPANRWMLEGNDAASTTVPTRRRRSYFPPYDFRYIHCPAESIPTVLRA